MNKIRESDSLKKKIHFNTAPNIYIYLALSNTPVLVGIYVYIYGVSVLVCRVGGRAADTAAIKMFHVMSPSQHATLHLLSAGFMLKNYKMRIFCCMAVSSFSRLNYPVAEVFEHNSGENLTKLPGQTPVVSISMISF